MSNKKNLSPKRAAQYAVFKAGYDRKMAAIAAIWTRACSACEDCGTAVMKPGEAPSPQRVGNVTFVDPKAPSAQTGKLRCHTCGTRALVIH